MKLEFRAELPRGGIAKLCPMMTATSYLLAAAAAEHTAFPPSEFSRLSALCCQEKNLLSQGSHSLGDDDRHTAHR